MHSVVGQPGEVALRDARCRVLWAVAIVSISFGASARAGFDVIDLGTLNGGRQSFGNGLGSTGRAAGSGTTEIGFTHGFVTSSGGSLVDLSTLPGGQNSEAHGVNAAGVAVGRSEVRDGGLLTIHAFLSRLNANDQPVVTDLGTLPGGSSSEARAINNSGAIAGFSDVAGGGTHAFVYQDGAMIDLGALASGLSSRALAINEAGSIAGWSGTSTGETHAVRSVPGGGLIDLGTLPGASFSFGQGINRSDQVVGYSGGGTFGSSRAILVEADGTIRDLGVLPGGVSSIAFGINDGGLIVGQTLLPNARTRAVIWGLDRVPVDLNSLISPASGWELSTAMGINAAGQIVGTGLIDVMTPTGLQRQTHAFLLDPTTPIVPIPAPSAATLLTVGLVGLVLLGRLGLAHLR